MEMRGQCVSIKTQVRDMTGVVAEENPLLQKSLRNYDTSLFPHLKCKARVKLMMA